MFETPFTVVGTVITDPIPRRVGEHNYLKFRVVSNSRKRTPDGNWENGNPLYLTVNCWGRVADGAAGVIYKGDPVVVVGYIYTDEYEDKEGNRRSDVEVRANSVGPDLTRCRAKLERTGSVAEPASTAEADDGAGTGDGGADGAENRELPISA